MILLFDPLALSEVEFDRWFNQRNNPRGSVWTWLMDLPASQNTQKIELMKLMLPNIPDSEMARNRTFRLSVFDACLAPGISEDPFVFEWHLDRVMRFELEDVSTSWKDMQSVGNTMAMVMDKLANTFPPFIEAREGYVTFFGDRARKLAEISCIVNQLLFRSCANPDFAASRQRLLATWGQFLVVPYVVNEIMTDPYGFIGFSDSGERYELWVDQTFLTECLELKSANLVGQWRCFMLFTGSQRNPQPVDGVDLEAVFSVFPIFQADFRAAMEGGKILGVVNALPMESQFKIQLGDIIRSGASHSRVKWVDDATQFTLTESFKDVLLYRGGDAEQARLHSDFLTALQNAFAALTRHRVPAYYLVLASFFTYISSSHILGTETLSPFSIRVLAVALMNEAIQLDPVLLPKEIATEWRNKLLGKGKAFTCTALLFNDQKRLINSNPDLKLVFDSVFPPKWR